MLGKTDWDFYPEQIAREIIQDDRSVIESGRPIVNKLEVIVDETGRLLWVLTTKTPARNKRRRDLRRDGADAAGRHHRHAARTATGSSPRSSTMSRSTTARQLEVSELARIACLSESQFRKRFVKLFKISPSKFINRIRVQTAAKLLVSSDAADRGHRRCNAASATRATSRGNSPVSSA